MGNRKLVTENKQKRDAAEKRLPKKAEKLSVALETSGQTWKGRRMLL